MNVKRIELYLSISIMKTTSLLSSFLLLSILTCAAAQTARNLTFMLITSFGGPGRFNSSGTVPAADIALTEINSRPDILPGYRLAYDTVRNSECDRQTSLDVFFDGVLSEPVKIGAVGCGCSVASEPVAEIIHHWNMPLIAYGTTSATLSDTSVFRNFFRANPPSTTLTPALFAIMRQFRWKRVGFITQDENRFQSVEEDVRIILEPQDIEVGSRSYETGSDLQKVEDLFLQDEDYRVFVLNSYPNPHVICEIHKRGLFYPKYTWVLYGWYALGSWLNEDAVDCTREQLRKVLENGISVEVFPIPEDMNAMTIADLTPEMFQEQYRAEAISDGYNPLDTTGAQLHDDVWGLALALNETMNMVATGDVVGTGCESMPGELVALEDFTHDNARMGCLVSWNLRQTNFSGVSGRVFFNESLIDQTATLLQYRLKGDFLSRVRFATVSRDTNFTFVYEEGFSDEQLYPDGLPADGRPEIASNEILLSLAVVVDILAFLGIIFAVVCLLFNIVFRERKIVKLTSPNLNYFIIVGTILMYLSIFFYLIPTSCSSLTLASCVIRDWLFTLGYALSYGALLARLWRVYHIFHKPAPKKKVFKDWHLILITLTMAGMALFLLFLGTVIPQLRPTVTEIRDTERPDGISDQDERIEFYVLICYEEASAPLYWKIFIYAYFAVFQILGMLLAFQTKRVKVRVLKDSTFVVINVYVSSLIILVFILLTFIFRDHLNVYSGVLAMGTFILTTTFLALTFIPKMVILCKDPNGDTLLDTISDTSSNKVSRSLNGGLQLDSMELEKVTVLERKLTERDQQIEGMRREMNTLRLQQ